MCSVATVEVWVSGMADLDEDPQANCPRCQGEGHRAGDAHDEWNRRVRGETPLQREDRRWIELLQEVRVAQTGVQILLAFLLTVAFTPRFAALDSGLKNIYVITLLLGAGATALLIAPVSIHRLTFGQRLKPQLVSVANVLMVAGLTMLVFTIGSALLLISISPSPRPRLCFPARFRSPRPPKWS